MLVGEVRGQRAAGVWYGAGLRARLERIAAAPTPSHDTREIATKGLG